ncbi:MAG: hypothetical protein WCL47_11510, partial [Holophagaceae bacterium]
MTLRPRAGLLGCFLLLATLLAGAAEPLRVQGDRQLVGPHAVALLDASRSMAVEQVHASGIGAFQPLP